MPDKDVPIPAARSAAALQFQKRFLLFLVVLITVLFLVMIRGFVVAVILAGVFAGMARPVFLWVADRLRARRTAAFLTVLGLLLVIGAPVGAFLALVVNQALEIAGAADPWIREQAGRWEEWALWARDLPFVGSMLPTQEAIAAGASEFAGRVGSFLVNNLTAATTGTVSLVVQVFVMSYAMYFFLLDGPAILARILYYTPLDDRSDRRLIERFVSVTRATIKGSIVVGLVQGALAGAAFFILGIAGAAFWSTVMAVLAVVPVLGAGLVWAPAAVILMSGGRVGAGVALAVWGFLVVSTIDNFLRPRLIGRDTKMHDLLVLLSTFGGLAMFGIVGFIVGPIVAALFLTLWGMFGETFGDLLPDQPLEKEAS